MHTAISWFVKNPVAANLMMFVLIVGGIMSLLTVHQEEFPSMDIRMVTISVPYLGAAPEEAEQGVCIRIEEVLKGTDGIEKIQSSASEGACTVTALLFEDSNPIVVLNEIKSQVDGINTFPIETEKPIVSNVIITSGVLQIAIFGDTDERTLKEIGKEIRDDIVAIEGVSTVSLHFVRPYEISIEVSEATLRRHGLTLDKVTQAIRDTSLDMPGGTLKTEGGDILLRTKGQAYW
ncbi:MAG: efflux RND transporter permease subunit, partial [Pseudomonadales bacterium]